MTRMTQRAFSRKFEEDKKGKVVKRKKTIGVGLKILGECSICFKPIYVSPGQLIKKDNDGGFSHKICRK